jgi:hypothetical protein
MFQAPYKLAPVSAYFMFVDSVALLSAIGPLPFVVISIRTLPNSKAVLFSFMPVALIDFAVIPFKLTFAFSLIVDELASVDPIVVNFYTFKLGVFVEESFEYEIFSN